MAKKKDQPKGEKKQLVQLDLFTGQPMLSAPQQIHSSSNGEDHHGRSVEKEPAKSPSRKAGKKESTKAPLSPVVKESDTNMEEEHWNRFVKHAQESDEKISERTQVWIDERLKKNLDWIKISILDIPTMHILNGIIQTFLEDHSERILKPLDDPNS